jgi:hypothetical protein
MAINATAKNCFLYIVSPPQNSSKISREIPENTLSPHFAEKMLKFINYIATASLVKNF